MTKKKLVVPDSPGQGKRPDQYENSMTLFFAAGTILLIGLGIYLLNLIFNFL